MRPVIGTLLVLWLTTIGLVTAQPTSQSGERKELSSFARIGLGYRSDYYYMGRADSSRVPYLTTSVGYYHKSGLRVSGSMSYLTAEDNGRIDLYTAAVGYDYYGRKLAAGVEVDKYYFSSESYSVQAEMNTYLSAYVGYDFGLFMAILDGSLGISQNTDVFVGGEISRTFYLLRDRLQITPSVYTNLGTQRYYNEYYTQRSIVTGAKGDGKGKGKGGGTSSGTTTTITEANVQSSEKFQVLDYETKLQILYKMGNINWVVSETVLFPVNPSTIVTDQQTYVEELNVGQYWSVGIRYTIR